MFQNPLRCRNFQENDPFSTLGSSATPQMTEGEAIASPNPFHHLFTAGAQPFEHTINPEQHFVHPHWVNGYDHTDGIHVDGYWRDGDGDTSHDLQVEDGGGYIQTNPDGSLFNNFG